MSTQARFVGIGSQREFAALRIALDRLSRDDAAEAATSRWSLQPSNIENAEIMDADVCIVFMSVWLDRHWLNTRSNRGKGIREAVRELAARHRTICLVTILRHIGTDATPGLLARIRWLNMIAIRLSEEFGCVVIDLDRELAGVGAQTYATDFALGGPYGIDAAAQHIAGTLHSVGAWPTPDRSSDAATRSALAAWVPATVPDEVSQRIDCTLVSAPSPDRRRRFASQLRGGFISWRAIFYLAGRVSRHTPRVLSRKLRKIKLR